MNYLLDVWRYLAAIALAVAGFAKVVRPADTNATIRALTRCEMPIARGLGFAEILTGTAFVAWPSALPGALAVGLLGCVFGSSAAIALWRKELVACSCFGAGGRGRLGWRQIALTPLWLLSSLFCWIESDRVVANSEGVIGRVCVLYFASCLVVGGRLVVIARAAAGDRRAAEEWLSPA